MTKIRKMDFLISFYIACLCIAELMGAKTFPLINIFGYQLNASVAIFVIPVLFTINDVVTEVYGKERTRSIIRSGLIMIFFLMIFSVFAAVLPPSGRFESSNDAYALIFGKSARIALASLIAFAIAEFLDVYIFVRIKNRIGEGKLWLRNNLSNFIAQFFDTTIFMFLAFYGFDKGFADNAAFLFSLIIPYWLLKCFMSILITPLVYIGVKWLKNDKEYVNSEGNINLADK